MKCLFLATLAIFLASNIAFGQNENALETDSIPDLSIRLEKQEEKKEEKTPKKKVKKKVFYGKKTKKSFVRNGRYLEIFYYLRAYQDPNPYIDDITWYHTSKKRIFTTEYKKIIKGQAKILHGPYIKKDDKGQIIEEGFYYFGVKHGRWEKYGRDAMDRDHVLLEKTLYYRGHLKESERTYYDTEMKKLKESIPIQNGKKEGKYFYYYQSGRIAIRGQYENGVKIGLWTEYYTNGQRSKEIQYPKTWLEKDQAAYILREWDSAGKMTEYTPNQKIIVEEKKADAQP